MFKIINKVWGREKILVNTELYCAKHLILEKGFQCSMHYHKVKDETFFILAGAVQLELDGNWHLLTKDMSMRVQPGQKHRFTGIEDSVILEVSTYDSPDDSYREDPSRRVK